MWAHNANADGAWLTLLVVSHPPKAPLGSSDYEQLAKAAARHLGFDNESLKVEIFAGFLRVSFPNTTGTPEFQLQIGADKLGIMCVQWRTTANPVSLQWILDHSNLAVSYTLTDIARRILSDSKDRQYSISLGNWPPQGIATDGIVNARHFSGRHVQGNRVYRQFKVSRRDPDGWTGICQFIAAVLSDAGYVGFEADLAALTRPSTKLTSPKSITAGQTS